ncbi:MAG: hypothetical protein PUG82_00635, partial [Streptococcus alactolyticus]|nr:hypothetical protein [Streptococcus alactolyticus]
MAHRLPCLLVYLLLVLPKKLTFVLWVLLIGSVGFGIYKNFTAIDTHTVRETEIIKQQIVDTNQV